MTRRDAIARLTDNESRLRRGPWAFRIRHMLEAIAECREFLGVMTREELGNDPRTLKAIAWNLSIHGEAARSIPPELEAERPDIPWAKIRGMRNHLVHGYDRIDQEIVWNVVAEELPPLVPELEAILKSADESRISNDTC